MSGILLDTSAYCEMVRGNDEICAEVQRTETIFVNPIILGELMAGFANGSREQSNQSILDRFLSTPRCSVVPILQSTALRYRAIWTMLRKAGTPLPTNDLWIAASAMEHGLVVLTTDTHFSVIPQVISRICRIQ